MCDSDREYPNIEEVKSQKIIQDLLFILFHRMNKFFFFSTENWYFFSLVMPCLPALLLTLIWFNWWRLPKLHLINRETLIFRSFKDNTHCTFNPVAFSSAARFWPLCDQTRRNKHQAYRRFNASIFH